MTPRVHSLRSHVLRRGSIVDVSWAVVQRSQGALYLQGAYRFPDGIDAQASLMEEIGLFH